MMRSALLVLLMLLPLPAFALETSAKQALLLDYDTGQVLLEKDSVAPVPPSSMSKLMTVYLLFERLKQGRIQLTDTLPVSEKAWRMQGSKMFVHVGDAVAVEDLLRGIIVQSGNDACVVVAEGLSGGEEAFAEAMNAKAGELGLNASHFVNATGWPDEGHVMSARDLATLAIRLMRDFPEHYHYFSETSFTYNNITQPNRDRLLTRGIGVDGLKTGHTDIGGYGITLSAKDAATGRRVVLVINGLDSDNARVEEGEKLIRYGLREFENRTLLRAGEKAGEAKVWFGNAPAVPLTTEQDIAVTLPVGAKEAEYTLVYESPLPAPVAKGEQVAELIIRQPGLPERTVQLVALEDVEKLGGLRKAWAVAKYYVLGRP